MRWLCGIAAGACGVAVGRLLGAGDREHLAWLLERRTRQTNATLALVAPARQRLESLAVENATLRSQVDALRMARNEAVDAARALKAALNKALER